MDNIIKMSFWKGLKTPFSVINQKMKEFFYLTTSVAFFNYIIFFILKNLSCYIREGVCINDFVAMILFVLLFVFFTSFYVAVWSKIVIENCKIIEVLKRKNMKYFFRTFLFVSFIFIVFACVFGVIAYLFNKAPSSSIIYESGIFVLLSVFIVICLYFLFSLPVFIAFLKEEKWFIFKKLFWPIFDNIHIISGWVSIILVLDVFLLKDFIQIFGDFGVFFVFYFTVSLLFSNLYYQYMIIFKKGD